MAISIKKHDLTARQAMAQAHEFCKTWEIQMNGVAFFNQNSRDFSYLIRTGLGYFWTFVTGVEHNKVSATVVGKLVKSINEKANLLSATTVGSVKGAGTAKFIELSEKGMKRKLIYIPEGENSEDGIDTKDLFESHKMLVQGKVDIETMDDVMGVYTTLSKAPEEKTTFVLGETINDKTGNPAYHVVSTSACYAWAVKKKIHTGSSYHLSVRCYSLPLNEDPSFPLDVLPYLNKKSDYASFHVEVKNNAEIAQVLGAVTAASNCTLNLYELGKATQ
jgi:hypothetical protein